MAKAGLWDEAGASGQAGTNRAPVCLLFFCGCSTAQAQCLVWKGPLKRIGQVSPRWQPSLSPAELLRPGYQGAKGMCSPTDPFDQGVVATDEGGAPGTIPIGPSMQASLGPGLGGETGRGWLRAAGPGPTPGRGWCWESCSNWLWPVGANLLVPHYAHLSDGPVTHRTLVFEKQQDSTGSRVRAVKEYHRLGGWSRLAILSRLLTCGLRGTLCQVCWGLNEIMDVNHLFVSTVPGT